MVILYLYALWCVSAEYIGFFKILKKKDVVTSLLVNTYSDFTYRFYDLLFVESLF